MLKFKKFLIRLLYVCLIPFIFFEIVVISPLVIISSLILIILGFICGLIIWIFTGLDVFELTDKLETKIVNSSNPIARFVVWYCDDWNIMKISFGLFDKLSDLYFNSEKNVN